MNEQVTRGAVREFNLSGDGQLRALNSYLHHEAKQEEPSLVRVTHPDGAHSIAAGVDTPVEIEVMGHAGYYLAGMNQHARITVHGNAGTGTAENMMSGLVRIKGFASTSAGASAHGGTLVIEGDASLRCGISLKGGDIVVGGSVGSFTAFMAQAGRIVICGDAGEALGDSLYEAVIYVRGKVASLGADARFEEMTAADIAAVKSLLDIAGFRHDPASFRKVTSARSLYHWNADANQEY
jgi:glutamate synthase domain-containing protein 3